MFFTRRFLFRSALATLAAIIFFATPAKAADTPCPKGKVRFGGLDWDSNTFHVEVARFILEKGYGCKTDIIAGTTLPMVTALGRGDVDVLMEVWEESIQEAWKKMKAAGTVADIGINFPDAIQGFYVPRYLVEGDASRQITAKAPDLKHVKDLIKYKLLFKDPEAPTKGRFLNCSLGWACETVNTKKLKIYGLLDHFINFRPGTGAALTAAIASNYARGEAFVAYYWGPTWVLGKYDLLRLEEPAYQQSIWQNFMKTKNPTQTTAYPPMKIKIGVNTDFLKRAPELIKFFRQYRTSNKIVSNALAFVEAKKGRTPKDAAMFFLREHQETWRQWLPKDVYSKVRKAAGLESTKEVAWKLDIATPINDFIEVLVRDHRPFFESIATPIRSLILLTENILGSIPFWVFSLGLILSAFLLGGFKLAVIVGLGLGLIGILGLWQLSVQTLALMIISTLVCVTIGLPIGIVLARSTRLQSLTLPLLDAMQTMPSFVYLIPALMLFGLGKVPALFATVIYAIAPMIKLTDLGIRRVDPHVLEASTAFGASGWQKLFGIQLPLALPTIMAGINQTIMLALSMVVVASMIGARGLGEQVLLGIQKLDVGQGFTAGLGIVALAIILDRLTQMAGKRIGK